VLLYVLNELEYANCYLPFVGLCFYFHENYMVDYGYVCVPFMEFLFLIFDLVKGIVEGILIMVAYIIWVKFTNISEQMREVIDRDDLT